MPGLSSLANKKWDEFDTCLSGTWHRTNHLTMLSEALLLHSQILGRENVEVCSVDGLTFIEV